MDKLKLKDKKIAGAPAKPMPRSLKLALVLFFCLFLVAAAVATVLGAKKLLFSGNERFLLRKIEVSSEGYWGSRGELLGRTLRLVPGRDNLYSLDLKDLRRRAEALPSIERCKLQKILPDTLKFILIERVPRARLQGNGELLLDSNGVLLPKKQCMSYSATLPLLAGFPESRLAPGEKLLSSLPALKLIMQTVLQYPDMEIIAVSVAREDALVFYLRYRKLPRLIKVTMPSDPKRMPFYLNALRSAILQSLSEGNPSTSCSLSFDGQVVWAPPAATAPNAFNMKRR